MPNIEVTAEILEDLSAVLGDAYAYRVGEGDESDEDDPEIWDTDREAMDRVKRVAKAFGVTFE